MTIETYVPTRPMPEGFNLAELFLTLSRKGHADMALNTAGDISRTGVQTRERWLESLVTIWAYDPKARRKNPPHPELAEWLDEQIEPATRFAGHQAAAAMDQVFRASANGRRHLRPVK